MMKAHKNDIQGNGCAVLTEGQRIDNNVGVRWKVLLIIRQFATIIVLITFRDLFSFQICLLYALSLLF
jgi:hypothetical protein